MIANAKAHIQPAALPGMDKINRYWDRNTGTWVAKILPGQLYVSISGELVVTVLGSCIAACIRDKNRGIGGMNHFMLPQESSSHQNSTLITRYGNWAMEILINEILKHGGSKQDLEVKIFGGARVVDGLSDVGAKNIEFVQSYLSQDELYVVSEDVGGERPRKVYYSPHTGRCRVKLLSSQRNTTVINREERYARSVAQNTDGGVELFNRNPETRH